MHIIDCDHLGWASYRVGGAAYAPLVAEFGDGILNPEDGEVDRKKLGPVVFGAPENLQKLNGIVWPVIQDMAVAEMKRLKAEQGVEICAMEAGRDQFMLFSPENLLENTDGALQPPSVLSRDGSPATF